jgi:hypothetical protein
VAVGSHRHEKKARQQSEKRQLEHILLYGENNSMFLFYFVFSPKFLLLFDNAPAKYIK